MCSLWYGPAKGSADQDGPVTLVTDAEEGVRVMRKRHPCNCGALRLLSSRRRVKRMLGKGVQGHLGLAELKTILLLGGTLAGRLRRGAGSHLPAVRLRRIKRWLQREQPLVGCGFGALDPGPLDSRTLGLRRLGYLHRGGSTSGGASSSSGTPPTGSGGAGGYSASSGGAGTGSPGTGGACGGQLHVEVPAPVGRGWSGAAVSDQLIRAAMAT